MKNLQIFFISFLITFSIMAQEKDVKIPEGINYHKASSEVNNKAKSILIDCINNNNPEALFDKAFICGPKLWQTLKDNNVADRIDGIKTTFHLNDKKMEGTTIQSKNSLILIWSFLFQETASAGIRKLTPDELIHYWSLVSYDIEEPIYIIEINELKLLVDIRDDNLKVVFLEIL